MPTRQRKQSKLRPLLAPAACLLVVAYFAHHAGVGEFGLSSLERLDAQEKSLQDELEALRAARERMEARVALMRSGSLDRDMVDERARQALNLAHPHDVVIFLPADSR
jgi:cell division protein FtsB